VVREDTFMNVSGGSLNITSQPYDIHGADNANTANRLRNIVQQPLPTSGPWTATARINWDPTQNFQNAGLMVYDADNRWIKAGMVWNGSRQFEAFKENNNNSPTALGSTAAPAGFPTTWYLRLTSNGTAIQAAFSADNQTWTNYGTTTNLTNFVTPTVGVYATTSTNAGAANKEMKVDWFKLATPQAPSDEFTGNALNLCRWTDIVRHEPAGYTVAGGNLTLPAAHGDFFAAGPNTNPNIILQPAPAGAWTATTRLTFNPNENYEQAGILVYGDDANYVKADYVFANGRGLEFLREYNDVAAGFDGFVSLTGRPTTVDMRIVSDGTTLRAYYRFAGGPWTAYGEPAPLAGITNPKIGLYANDSNATVTSREDAVFDFFRLEAGAPDTTAPTTTSTLSPESPDGQNGWYRTDPTLTLATESGATTEYQVGNGAFQPYNGPVTISQEGTTTVTYRSTDAEGNREADKSITVKLDKTAPTSTATLSPAAANGQDGWYRSDVQLTIATENGATTQYKVGDGAFQTYSGPVTLDQEGTTTVTYRSTDEAGNQEETDKTVTVKIDKTAPTSTATKDPAQANADGDYSGPVTVTLTGADAAGGSGLERVEYRLDDDGEWTTYTGPVTLSRDGQHTLEHRAVDKAGNEGATTTETLTIKTPTTQQPQPQPQPSVMPTPTVTPPRGPVTRPDATNPRLRLLSPRSQSIAKLRSDGLSFRIGVDEAVTLRVTLYGRFTSAKVRKGASARVAARGKRKLIGRMTVTGVRAGETTVRLKLSSKVIRRLRAEKRFPGVISVRATDAAGNASTRTKVLFFK
jgi:regulation of enolase protein 1 (concanavalin A-like superfamily)